MREKMRKEIEMNNNQNPHSLASWNDSQTDETKKQNMITKRQINIDIFTYFILRISIKNQSHQIIIYFKTSMSSVC